MVERDCSCKTLEQRLTMICHMAALQACMQSCLVIELVIQPMRWSCHEGGRGTADKASSTTGDVTDGSHSHGIVQC